jgi:hypothetical protein
VEDHPSLLGFVASLVRSLAWPAFAGVLLYMLRKQIGGVFARLLELSLPGGVSAKFSATMVEAKQTAQKVMIDEAAQPAIDQGRVGNRIFGPEHKFPSAETVKTSASVDPEEAILRSFLEVDRALGKVFHWLYPNNELYGWLPLHGRTTLGKSNQ